MIPPARLADPDASRDGAALLRAGRVAEAEAPFRAALRARPDAPELHSTLGAILATLGRSGEAEASFRAALRLRPDSPDAHGNLGNLLRERGGRAKDAERHLREALRLRPGYPEAHNNLGALLRERGRLGEAERHFREAARLRPNLADAHGNLGRLLRQLGRHAEAEPCLREAARLRPGDAGALAELGAALREGGRAAEAERCLREASRLRPGDTGARVELGKALLDGGRPDEAEGCFREALGGAAGRDLPGAHLGLGVALGTLGRFAEAERSLREALRLRPGFAEARNSLGAVLRDLGRHEEAERSLRDALRLRPDFAEAWTNLAFVLLQTGRFAEGWRAHEHRWRARPWCAGVRPFAQPLWRGEPLGGRTLLLHAEQGLGDTLQFCRYAPAAAPGGRVLLEAQGPLAPLLSGLPGVSRVVRRGEALPPFDLHCPLMSLPHVLGATDAAMPGPIPYLSADPARVAAWRERLAGLPGLRVGLAWAGDPAMAADRRRSLELGTLAPLAGLEGASFVSLQVGPAAAQRPPPGLTLHGEAAADLRDFADTAALVQTLDLVVSVDTAVVHLAGALGKAVWLLNRFDACWRWPRARDDNPWYPTLRQFRQRRPGDWTGVVSELRAALACLPTPGTDPG